MGPPSWRRQTLGPGTRAVAESQVPKSSASSTVAGASADPLSLWVSECCGWVEETSCRTVAISLTATFAKTFSRVGALEHLCQTPSRWTWGRQQHLQCCQSDTCELQYYLRFYAPAALLLSSSQEA